jgi:hypothetical protein
VALLDAIVAPKGSTGANTHASVAVPEVFESICLNFVVEVAGATPTVTYKFQGSIDPLETSDANSTWTDIDYVLPGTADTLANATRARTAVGGDPIWLARGVSARFWRKIRLVTSSNTNVTYRAELCAQDSNE